MFMYKLNLSYVIYDYLLYSLLGTNKFATSGCCMMSYILATVKDEF